MGARWASAMPSRRPYRDGFAGPQMIGMVVEARAGTRPACRIISAPNRGTTGDTCQLRGVAVKMRVS